MTSAIRNATHGFRIHKDLPPFQIHASLGHLFDSDSNPTSLILKRFHILLPLIANVACAPSVPSADRPTHCLRHISAHSARSRFKSHCSEIITHSLHQEMYATTPENFHLLLS